MISFARYGYFTDEEQTPGGSTIWFIAPMSSKG